MSCFSVFIFKKNISTRKIDREKFILTWDTGFNITFVGDWGTDILTDETVDVTVVGHTTAATLDPEFNVEIVELVAGAILLGDLEYVTGPYATF